MEPRRALRTSSWAGTRLRSSATWLTRPTTRPPSRRESRVSITPSRVSASSAPKPSSMKRVSSWVPPASWLTVSASPRARARETMNVSPPDRVAGSRCLPLHSSRTRRLRPAALLAGAALVGLLEGETLVGHRAEPLVGGCHDLAQPLGEDVGGQPHPELVVGALALDQRGQAGGEGVLGTHRSPRGECLGELIGQGLETLHPQAGLLMSRVLLVAQPAGLGDLRGEPVRSGSVSARAARTASSARTESAAARLALRWSSCRAWATASPPGSTAASASASDEKPASEAAESAAAVACLSSWAARSRAVRPRGPRRARRRRGDGLRGERRPS